MQERGAAVAWKNTNAERARIVVNFMLIEVKKGHEVGDESGKWVQDRKIGFKDQQRINDPVANLVKKTKRGCGWWGADQSS